MAGTPYLIRVGGFNGATGTGTLVLAGLLSLVFGTQASQGVRHPEKAAAQNAPPGKAYPQSAPAQDDGFGAKPATKPPKKKLDSSDPWAK